MALLTSVDAPRMPLDLRLRSRQFSALLSRSRADVPPMCPGASRSAPSHLALKSQWSEAAPSKIVKLSGLAGCDQDTCS